MYRTQTMGSNVRSNLCTKLFSGEAILRQTGAASISLMCSVLSFASRSDSSTLLEEADSCLEDILID